MTTRTAEKKPPTTDARCGSYRGYSRHRHRGEDPCTDCKQAASAHDRARRARIASERPKPDPVVDDDPAPSRAEILTAEIEFLLACGEGEHAITSAFGIKPLSLQRKLHRLGRADLIPRVFEHQARMTDVRDNSGEYAKLAYAYLRNRK